MIVDRSSMTFSPMDPQSRTSAKQGPLLTAQDLIEMLLYEIDHNPSVFYRIEIPDIIKPMPRIANAESDPFFGSEEVVSGTLSILLVLVLRVVSLDVIFGLLVVHGDETGHEDLAGFRHQEAYFVSAVNFLDVDSKGDNFSQVSFVERHPGAGKQSRHVRLPQAEREHGEAAFFRENRVRRRHLEIYFCCLFFSRP